MLWFVLSTSGGNWATAREQPKTPSLSMHTAVRLNDPGMRTNSLKSAAGPAFYFGPSGFWHILRQEPIRLVAFLRDYPTFLRENFTFRLPIEAWRHQRRYGRWKDMCVPSGRSIWYVYRVYDVMLRWIYFLGAYSGNRHKYLCAISGHKHSVSEPFKKYTAFIIGSRRRRDHCWWRLAWRRKI